MKAFITFLTLFSAISGFSQSEFTPKQIDSIANISGRSGIAEGMIDSQKQVDNGDMKRITKGEGQSSIAIYLHKPEKSRLIKGEYFRNVRYQDKSSEEVYAHFYYNEKQLFSVKIKEIIKNPKENITKDHDINISEMNKLQAKDFLFTENIKKWISQVDAQIRKLYVDKQSKKAE